LNNLKRNNMTTIKSFVNRLEKIGINVELISNHPWVYLYKVNGKFVKGKFNSEYGFTVFFKALFIDQPDTICDTKIIFNKIREML